MGAKGGVEPPSLAYEASVVPLDYSAKYRKWCASVRGGSGLFSTMIFVFGFLDAVLGFASGILVLVGGAARTGKIESFKPVVDRRVFGVLDIFLSHYFVLPIAHEGCLNKPCVSARPGSCLS